MIVVGIARPGTRRYAHGHGQRFIQVQAAKVANPTSCLGIKYGALCLVLVWFRCAARYPALLYIVQGVGS
jgi:hypothetical protein